MLIFIVVYVIMVVLHRRIILLGLTIARIATNLARLAQGH